MRTILYTVLIAFCIAPATGCKKFIDVNNDPNNPTSVQESLILSPVELNVSSVLTGGAGTDGLAAILVNHYMQNVALNQPVPNHGTYLLFNVDLDETWRTIYVKSLNNLKVLNDKATANGNYNYSGIARIMSAFCLGIATDYWGDIPYTEALNGSNKLQPAYDSQESIYKAIQQLLDDGIADINKNALLKPGKDDYFYKGNMDQWKRLAYTLKARYYMHLTKAPGYTALAQADLALTALQNGLQANSDDMKMTYAGGAGNENPYYTDFLPVSTLVLSSACVDTLVTRNDPRLPKLIAKAKQTDQYTGRPIGSVNISGSLNIYSLPGTAVGAASSPVYVFNYSEALFLKAEATLIKSGYAAAEPVYQDAIRSHMTKLGIADADVNTYLNSRGTLTAANALQRIMEEKKIANFFSLENFNDWRRTGYPTLTKVPNATSEIPRRMLYPQVEILSNPQAVQSARITDRVWWDK
ncbi:SusD/RagB family nutrient-binding outer membrane lipoprotein [Niastella caeni]|uniref:SusD/RagB family nutrient-binding outer membrane lipoprotein n=1 Tax=Niastella caeni TaxID=2569763 RepID=A0A4S8HH35_9BACT|nr:SusD/RagB family nutrient-binding outer membrane lipoprotein [Niastella caeni]THU32062.1 SusD/RagB family nutrient-binding outer membrane lipoprotein [Niastella caeni]